MHMATQKRRRPAFSMLELVIVLAIGAIIGAIAIPRLSSASSDSGTVAYTADLVMVQSAIERYATEHGGQYPTKADFAAQLTRFTDINGSVSAVKTNTHIYGPYLRKVPDLFIGSISPDEKGEDAGDDVDGNGEVEAIVEDTEGDDTGWRYDARSGRVRAVNRPFEVHAPNKFLDSGG